MTDPNETNQVEIIVEATNKLSLVFPEDVNAQIKSKINMDDLLKILTVDDEDDVTGQCHHYSVAMGIRG